VGLVTLAEAERGGKVAGEHVDLLDVGNESLVNGLLVSRPAAGNLLLLGLLALLEESLLASLLLGLLGGVVLGLGNLLNLGLVDAGKVDLERGGDNISGVDAAEGNTVDLEGAGNEEDALVEGLEEDDTLATEATGQENQDGTGLEGAAGSPGTGGLAGLQK